MTSLDNTPVTKTRAPDPRPARTRAAIYRAATELSESGADISVNDIVKRAGVSRASFYAHFSNLEDVAGGIIESQLEKLHEVAKEQMADSYSLGECVRAAVRATTGFIAAHRAFFGGVLSWRISHNSYAYLTGKIAGYWMIALQRADEDGLLPADVRREPLARFLAGGVLDLYVQWLLDDGVRPDADMSAEADALAEAVVSALPRWLVEEGPSAQQ